MGKCRSCGAEILWIETPGGKAMPCNPEPVYYWVGEGKERVVTPNGEVIACKLTGDLSDATGIGYIPHWGTCKDAQRFRNNGR